jgi:hypothetical protein
VGYEKETIEYQRPPETTTVPMVSCDGCPRKATLSKEEVEKIRGGLARGAGCFAIPPLQVTGWVEIAELVQEEAGPWRKPLKLFCPDCRGKAGV